jgi:2-phosphosulfolactate phosphatase
VALGQAGSDIVVDVAFRWEDARAPAGPALVGVIDALRATSTIVTALAAGAASVLPVETVEEAFGLRTADPRRLLAGERGAHPIPGFDFGNSPAALAHAGAVLVGRQLVLTTTNGTRAVAWAVRHTRDQRGGGQVTALALLNVGAWAMLARAVSPERIYLLCSGTEGGFALDDAYVAGAAIEGLLGGPLGPRLRLSEAGLVALHVFRAAADRAYDVFCAAAAGRNLLRKGYGADVAFCARRDAYRVVPVWRDGALRGECPGEAGGP